MKILKTVSGTEVPNVGLGTFPFQGRVMADIVKQAVKIGYRLFDTSDDYRGEVGLGLAIDELIARGDCQREDLFIQTKISDNNAYANEPLIGVYFNSRHSFMNRHTVKEIVREKVDVSLRSMNTSYLDSLLIHYPYPDYFVDIWRELISLREEGLVKYIGVSNFHIKHIELLINETSVFPDINEIYISPISTKNGIIDYCLKNNCIPMVYSPLMDIHAGRIPYKSLEHLVKKYGKSVAQIVLRWNIDRGCFPLPKTKNFTRLKDNFSVFDFSLMPEEISQINSLNYDYQYLVESKICPGI